MRKFMLASLFMLSLESLSPLRCHKGHSHLLQLGNSTPRQALVPCFIANRYSKTGSSRKKLSFALLQEGHKHRAKMSLQGNDENPSGKLWGHVTAGHARTHRRRHKAAAESARSCKHNAASYRVQRTPDSTANIHETWHGWACKCFRSSTRTCTRTRTHNREARLYVSLLTDHGKKMSQMRNLICMTWCFSLSFLFFFSSLLEIAGCIHNLHQPPSVSLSPSFSFSTPLSPSPPPSLSPSLLAIWFHFFFSCSFCSLTYCRMCRCHQKLFTFQRFDAIATCVQTTPSTFCSASGNKRRSGRGSCFI